MVEVLKNAIVAFVKKQYLGKHGIMVKNIVNLVGRKEQEIPDLWMVEVMNHILLISIIY